MRLNVLHYLAQYECVGQLNHPSVSSNRDIAALRALPSWVERTDTELLWTTVLSSLWRQDRGSLWGPPEGGGQQLSPTPSAWGGNHHGSLQWTILLCQNGWQRAEGILGWRILQYSGSKYGQLPLPRILSYLPLLGPGSFSDEVWVQAWECIELLPNSVPACVLLD